MYKLVKYFSFSILCFSLFTASSFAEETATKKTDSTVETRNALISTVVNDQIDAFSKDDGERAFSYASPKIQAYFKTPETFMQMVKSGYKMVYRPKSFEIEAVREANGIIFQPVLFTDQQSQLYKVLYQMQQQEDKSWKINGVQVLRPKGLAI